VTRAPALLRLALAGLLPLAAGPAAPAELEFEPVLAAIERVESSGHPWSILDNTTGRSYALADRGAAEKYARYLIGLGHNLDLGLYQINTIQLRRPDVSIDTIFDPAAQQQLARSILGEFLTRARERFGDTDLAWERAIGAYNGGSILVENAPYVARVFGVLGLGAGGHAAGGTATPPSMPDAGMADAGPEAAPIAEESVPAPEALLAVILLALLACGGAWAAAVKVLAAISWQLGSLGGQSSIAGTPAARTAGRTG
jgi:type IV secretion system protein VirB1